MLPEPFFVMTKSGLPSPFRSPTATLVGVADRGKEGATMKADPVVECSGDKSADWAVADAPHKVRQRTTESNKENLCYIQIAT